MSDKLVANETLAGNNLGEVTGSPVGSTKFGIDVAVASGDHFQAVMALIAGTLPEINWNSISKTYTSATVITYAFEYYGNQQFEVVVTNPFGAWTITITEYVNLITEDGLSAIGLEDGSELLLEG